MLLPRESGTYGSVLDMGPLDPDLDRRLIFHLTAQGAPLIDRFAMGLALQHQPCGPAWHQLIEQAGPGVTYLSLHCSAPGEIERLHPSDAGFRIAEYELFRDPGFLGWVAGQNVKLADFRAIREVWRSWLAVP